MLPEKYAKALYDLMKDKSENEQDKLFSNFLKVLERNGHSKLLPRVLKSFEKISFQEKTDTSVDFVVSDSKFEDKYKAQIKKYSKYFDKDQEVQTKTDSSIVGGFMIRSKNVVVDGSYKRSLVNLYNKFIK